MFWPGGSGFVVIFGDRYFRYGSIKLWFYFIVEIMQQYGSGSLFWWIRIYFLLWRKFLCCLDTNWGMVDPYLYSGSNFADPVSFSIWIRPQYYISNLLFYFLGGAWPALRDHVGPDGASCSRSGFRGSRSAWSGTAECSLHQHRPGCNDQGGHQASWG